MRILDEQIYGRLDHFGDPLERLDKIGSGLGKILSETEHGI
ncbi:hypothetical protein FACS1894187_23100 [Synergistales bacterium]|nr:hypothetical protein FACS1894187_23100 [Synergistales bacterium]